VDFFDVVFGLAAGGAAFAGVFFVVFADVVVVFGLPNSLLLLPRSWPKVEADSKMKHAAKIAQLLFEKLTILHISYRLIFLHQTEAQDLVLCICRNKRSIG